MLYIYFFFTYYKCICILLYKNVSFIIWTLAGKPGLCCHLSVVKFNCGKNPPEFLLHYIDTQKCRLYTCW